MKLNLKTILLILLTVKFGQANAQTVQLVPDSCTFCLFLVSNGGTGWYQSGYGIYPDNDTLVLGNNYMRVNSGMMPMQPFAIRQVGNKLMGVVADSLSEYLLMDFDAVEGDTIHSLYSEGFFYDAVVLNKDSVAVNNGVFHQYMRLQATGIYINSVFQEGGGWNLVWNERGLCAVNGAELGGVLYNIPSYYYVISAPYAFPEFCTTDPIYNNPASVTCDNCYAQTNGVDELSSSMLEIVPNPAVNEITVRSEESFIHEVEIYDALGQKIKEQQINSLEAVVGISELSEGAYFIRVYTDKGYGFARFIKK